MDRPFKDRRPIGPFLGVDRDDSSEEDDENIQSIDNIDDPILQQAERWYENITKQGKKRKMMKNYLMSIADIKEEEIEEMLDNAGI